MSQSNGIWTLYSAKNLEFRYFVSSIPIFALLLRFWSWRAHIMNKKTLQKYICRTFRNMFAELLKIYSLCLRKYVCWCCSGRRLRSGTEGNNIYAERPALTASHKPLARSTFSTDRSFHRTGFFWSRLIFEEDGSKIIEDPLLTFADAGNLVEVVLRVVVEVGSVPLVF